MSCKPARGSARNHSILVLVSSLLATNSLAVASEELAVPSSRAIASVYGGFGLSTASGELVGSGPTYKAFFRRGGVEFHPALGAAASRNLPLHLALESIGRGAASIGAATAAEPETLGEFSVVYRHGASLVERYDVREGGIEQSFVLESLPAGGGDLVVRLRASSELRGEARGDGLRFEASGIGGVAIGAVTGIDADGRRCAGTSSTDGEVVELVLPAAFVDTARFPLIVDPLISTAGGVAVGGDVRRPDVAFDAATARWLVVWDVTFSAADVDVRGQLLTDVGNPVGPLLHLESFTTTYSFRPVVANVRGSGRFLVVWQEGGPEQTPPSIPFLRGVSVNPAIAIQSNIASFWGNGSAHDLAGDSTEGNTDAVLVFENGNASDIRAALVNVPPVGVPNLHTSFLLGTSSADTQPTISKHGGSSRRYAIGWRHQFSANDRDIEARLLSPATGLIGAKVTIGASVKDEGRPRCDGNGVNFAFAWEQLQTTGDHDVVVRRATWHDASISFSSEVGVAPAVGVDEVEPDITFCGPKYMIAWSEQLSGADYDLYITGLEPNDLVQAEPIAAVDLGNDLLGDRGVAAFSRLDAGATGDAAMMTWNSLGFPTFTSSIHVQRVEAIGQGGPVLELGGACGAGGTNSIVGPIAVGNHQFQVVLIGAAPAAPAGILNLSLPGPTLTCGGCVWNPYLFTLSIPLVGGNASVTLPIPMDLALGGLVFETQWSVQNSGVTPCSLGPGLSLSNRQRMMIGY